MLFNFDCILSCKEYLCPVQNQIKKKNLKTPSQKHKDQTIEFTGSNLIPV